MNSSFCLSVSLPSLSETEYSTRTGSSDAEAGGSKEGEKVGGQKPFNRGTWKGRP